MNSADGGQHSYTQGHSKYTTATHEVRKAEQDAAFLLPHIKKTDHILDVGCGPGSITIGLVKHASAGTIIGIDISEDVLQKAKTLAADAEIPTEGPGSVTFELGNVLEGLSFPDDTFDVVFCSQLFGHIPPPDLPRQALKELRRVLKTGGVFASRDGVAHHFYPQSFDLDRLWALNARKALAKGAPPADPTGTIMPALLRSVGYDVDGGKVEIGAGARVFAGKQTRQFLAWRVTGQLKEGDPVRQSWLDAGISEEEIGQAMRAAEQWAATEDAWYASLQSEILAWK
ncbi:S-adenosyl-L-methionine-dependent methyltransferase [Microthyrium microscopicum]|uniref:S-adenosyl-L-methionine-dependent methyltransferase n=1 Tax=Microthyrium microscopicum TaxID=703497 RepID=A0A6A6UTB6_9PEZI|nr:S-adenosyl-L-methionine-dependent methyltransferase [Microthyrium microscopicum]